MIDPESSAQACLVLTGLVLPVILARLVKGPLFWLFLLLQGNPPCD